MGLTKSWQVTSSWLWFEFFFFNCSIDHWWFSFPDIRKSMSLFHRGSAKKLATRLSVLIPAQAYSDSADSQVLQALKVATVTVT